ncbi:hypothetical protein [Achromobacter spanius]
MKTISPESPDLTLLAAVAVALVNTPRAPLHEPDGYRGGER